MPNIDALGRCVAVTAGAAVLAGLTTGGAPAASIAREWNEEWLQAIRVDRPNPPVHARNLFHLSIAMWDAWAAYDSVAVGCFHRERTVAADVPAARHEAISYAAYRVLANRSAQSATPATTLAALTAKMELLGYDPGIAVTTGNSAAAVGNRVAASIIAFCTPDGSNQEGGYSDSTYAAVNEPMILELGGTGAADPNRWQPLAFGMVDNGTGPEPVDVQTFLGSGWGRCRPFSLERSAPDLPWITVGEPPRLGTATADACRDQHFALLRFSSWLDAADATTIDISPSVRGNNSPGGNDGSGHPVNPATGEAYSPNVVKRCDHTRVLAEFWADGPNSRSPAGHWNEIANHVADNLPGGRRIGGSGPEVDALEWDVKVYLVLNAALHDAACAAWTLKRLTDAARPITTIRYMAQRGQSTDPEGPAFDPDGLPLEAGLCEVITAESAAPGERHAHLSAHVGAIAVRSWAGEPPSPANSAAGTAWQLGRNWVPYARESFVSPPSAGYVSGHSALGRAAAEGLAAMVGSPFFPGGIWSVTAPAGAFLAVEDGPTTDVTLEWATFFDAADDAGLSRRFSGVAIAAADTGGRLIGAAAGRQAWERAREYFDGSIMDRAFDPDVTVAGSTLGLRWRSVRGLAYNVQSTANLVDWVDESPFTKAVDTEGVHSASITSEDRFRRIVREPRP